MLNNKTSFFSQFYFISFCVICFAIPFAAWISFFITPLLLIVWIIERNWTNKWNSIKESQTLFIIILFAFFWFINIIGLFYSNDLLKGLERTYHKLPFFVYPLVFFTLDKTFFTKEKICILFKLFLAATTLMLLISWGNSLIHYIKTGDSGYFYYIYFSHYFGHPSYYSLKVCIASTIAFYFFNHRTQRPYIAMMIFFAVSIFFLQSRTGILTFIMIALISIFYYLHYHYKSLWYGIGGIVLFILLAVVAIIFFPNRIEEQIKNINPEQTKAHIILGSRNEIWSTAYQLALKHKLTGIGTGYHTESYLSETEMEIFNKNHLFINTHNQFLQKFLEHGIGGFLALVLLIIYSIWFSIKTKNYLLLMLMIALLINIIFECMLERTQGIFTFLFFYGLFIVKNNIFATANSKTISYL
jgi:O-antigen ligase